MTIGELKPRTGKLGRMQAESGPGSKRAWRTTRVHEAQEGEGRMSADRR